MTEPAAAAATAGEATNTDDGAPQQQQLSLAERYEQAVALTETSPATAIPNLERLQQDVARLSLFSSNETVEDISTKSLPLLALDHFLAVAYTRLPSAPGQIRCRHAHLQKSIDLWACFLNKLESLGSDLVTPAEQKEYYGLMEYTHHHNNTNSDDHNVNAGSSSSSLVAAPPAPRREDKIARFRAKQQAQQEVARLRSLRERRSRIGIPAEDVMDDLDEESLDRSVAMTHLLLHKAEALEEWASTLRELPMIERMVQMEGQRSHMERHAGTTRPNGSSPSSSQAIDARQRPPAPATGLEVTHVTLDAGSGQLQFRKEEVKSQVFRPGWNQPTMSLQDFADREVTQAMEREDRQKHAEANGVQGPRRYEQLVKDGMEDNVDAVDASAVLDRAWDDWKDANPRGSGNKRGDQGDRNF